jgi:hypothetical protein
MHSALPLTSWAPGVSLQAAVDGRSAWQTTLARGHAPFDFVEQGFLLSNGRVRPADITIKEVANQKVYNEGLLRSETLSDRSDYGEQHMVLLQFFEYVEEEYRKVESSIGLPPAGLPGAVQGTAPKAAPNGSSPQAHV